MDAATTYLAAAALADDEAELRMAVVEVVRKMIEVELQAMVLNGQMGNIMRNTVMNMEWEIKKMALRALKDHINNPQFIQ